MTQLLAVEKYLRGSHQARVALRAARDHEAGHVPAQTHPATRAALGRYGLAELRTRDDGALVTVITDTGRAALTWLPGGR